MVSSRSVQENPELVGAHYSLFQMSRRVAQKVFSQWMNEGAGARVRRSIGTPQLRNLDPFLMLDEFSVKAPAGFPDHPHRGFETVTFLLSGEIRHEDFIGNKGTLTPGDLQWMSAGRGVVHCEMPHGEEPAHGLQLWVNLSRENKMIEPSWQDLLAKDIPTATKDGVHVRIIAGSCMDITSPIYTRTPTFYLDFTLEPGSKFTQPTEPDWSVFAYTLSGQVTLSGQETDAHNTVVLVEGSHVDMENKGEESAHFVLVGGKPLEEPVVQQGPFVMNTEKEIAETKADYGGYRNGFERARNWNSSYAD